MRDMRDRGAHNGGRKPYPLEEPDTSLGELVGRLSGELGGLLSDHMQLAREEMKRDAKKAGRGAGLMGGAGLGGWIAALILSLALAWGLAELMPIWVAFLIVGVVWAIAAAVMGLVGKKQLDEVGPVAPETMEELQRDKQWFSRQTT